MVIRRWRKEERNNFQSYGTTGIKDEKYISRNSQRTIGKLYRVYTKEWCGFKR